MKEWIKEHKVVVGLFILCPIIAALIVIAVFHASFFPAKQTNTAENDSTLIAKIESAKATLAIRPSSTLVPAQTPIPSEEPSIAPTIAVPEKEYVNMSFEEALRLGKVTIKIYAPWNATMVFTFEPKFVNFDKEGFGDACPYDQGISCVDTFDNGVYALTHSEYKDAVAEQARIIMEGVDMDKLYKLSKITKHVKNLPGASVEIKLSDGRYINAVVSEVKRTVGLNNIYDTAKSRYASPDTLVLEFCGLPHAEDGTDSAGWTGSIYQITIEME
jgi:hypothetical protein